MDNESELGKVGPGGDDAAKQVLAVLPDDFDRDDDAELSRLLQSESDDADDEDMDETIAERLIGLTEMFPERLRNFVSGLVGSTWHGSKWMFNAGRVGIWVVTSSAVILALPVMFENERSQMEEQQIQHQRQMLLGPNVAMSGHMSTGLTPGGMPPLPQVTPPGR